MVLLYNICVIFLIATAVLSTTATIFYTYNTTATKKWLKSHSDYGKLVDIGGQELFITLKGQGSPVVIFETDWGSISPEWWDIQDKVSRHATVLTYCRAGYGWSKSKHSSATSGQVVSQLRNLLKHEGIHPPYIFVGHSLGALYIQHFIREYPTEAAGAVFICPTSLEIHKLDHLNTPNYNKQTSNSSYNKILSKSKYLACFGIMRLIMPSVKIFLSSHPKENLKRELQNHVLENMLNPRFYDAKWNELMGINQSIAEITKLEKFPDIRIKVIQNAFQDNVLEMVNTMKIPVDEAEQVELLSLELYKSFLKLSSKSELITIAHSTRNSIHLEHPGIIADEIIDMISKVS